MWFVCSCLSLPVFLFSVFFFFFLYSLLFLYKFSTCGDLLAEWKIAPWLQTGSHPLSVLCAPGSVTKAI